MVTRLVQATISVASLLLIAAASPASAQSDYLAPIPAPAGRGCGDTAPDCAAICNTHRDSVGACHSSTPIGDYLRANCKSTCGVCESQLRATPTFITAGAPSPSQGMQPPLAYGMRSGTLSPSPCTFSCVDIPPPGSPYTCAEQERFGKCNSTFMTTPTRGLLQGYCQITCGRCYSTPSCKSRPTMPVTVASIITGTMIPVTSPSTPEGSSPLTPLPATSAGVGTPTAVAGSQSSGVPVQSTAASSSPADPAAAPADPAAAPADTIRSTSTLGVPDALLAPGTPLQSAATSTSPVIPPTTPSTASPQASSMLSPFTAFTSSLPSSEQSAGTNPASSTPAQNSVAGSAVSAPSSSVPETAAESPIVLRSLFGSPIAIGSDSSPVQAYIQIPGVPPIQSLVAVPAITTAGTATPDASALQSHVNTLSLAPAAQLLLGATARSPAQPATLVPAPLAETPAVSTSSPGTFAAVCFDIPPPQSAYTCAEQRDFGKCDAPFMLAATPEAPSGYCQITCKRCRIPDSAETRTAAPPVTNLRPSPSLPNTSNVTSSPALESAFPTSPAASDSFLQAPEAALPPPVTSPSSPATQGYNTSAQEAPANEVSSVPVSSETLLPGALGSANAPATPPGTSLPSSVPAPRSPTSNVIAFGTPAAAPSSPVECVDLQSDCKFLCHQLSNDCSKPGGVGDYLRANCKQTCNLCPTSSPAIGCTEYTWITGQWGVCNSTCGVGFHNRSVSCMGHGPSLSLQSEADPALCNDAVKPANIATCIRVPCAANYSATCAVTAAPAGSGRRLFQW